MRRSAIWCGRVAYHARAAPTWRHQLARQRQPRTASCPTGLRSRSLQSLMRTPSLEPKSCWRKLRSSRRVTRSRPALCRVWCRAVNAAMRCGARRHARRLATPTIIDASDLMLGAFSAGTGVLPPSPHATHCVCGIGSSGLSGGESKKAGGGTNVRDGGVVCAGDYPKIGGHTFQGEFTLAACVRAPMRSVVQNLPWRRKAWGGSARRSDKVVVDGCRDEVTVRAASRPN